MRTRRLLPLSLLAAVALAAPLAVDAGRAPNSPWLSTADAERRLNNPDFMLGDASRELAPSDWLLARNGSASGDDLARALADAQRIAAETALTDPALANLAWESLGPTNIGGRVLDIAIDPTVDNTVYIAAATGGVWKSTDAGTTFTRSWSYGAPASVGALAVGSDGVLYAGSGEAGPGGGSVTFGGTGIYRSRDGAKTWQYVGLRRSGAFGRIVVDPTDPKRVFAAATGDLFRPGGDRGLYRSLDGGTTWKRVLAGATKFTGAVDIAIDPVNPQRMFAAMWDHRRLPDHREYGGKGSGLFKSLDGGATWQRVAGIELEDAEEATGRIGIAIAPSQPDRVYALVMTASGRYSGMYRSDDFGGEWTPIGDSMVQGNGSTYGWWFGRVYVDPLAPDRVFSTGLELLESVDGGMTFVPHSTVLAGVATGQHEIFVHADQHAMAFSERQPTLVYIGNDGGVYRSVTHGTAGSWVAALRQGWTQHYSVDVSMQTPARVVSGLQDNLCQRNYTVGPLADPGAWNKYTLCGDGLQTLINPLDELLVYGCSQYGSCSRSIDGGFSFTSFGSTESDRRGWWVPVQFDPTDPLVMYYGGNILNRSTNGGDTWTAISPDLSTDPDQLDPDPGYQIYGTITSVAAAPTDPDTLLVGTDEGLLWITDDLGESWQQLRARNLPKQWVTRVAIDPRNPRVLYATYSAYRAGNGAPLVMRSADSGRTWTAIGKELPAVPVNEILALGGNNLVIGTDTGVYLTRDLGKHWLSVGKAMPIVPILDLHWHPGSRLLTAATFGNGVMRVHIP